MLKRTFFFTLCLVMAFSISTFAGEGSDTVGDGKMLPQLRYGYTVSDWNTDSTMLAPLTDWDVDAHDYYAQFNWGVHPNVDIYAIVGGRSIRMKSEFAGVEYRTDYEPMFLWGLGVKGTFYRSDSGFYLGGGLRFTHSISNDYGLKLYAGGVLVAEYPDMFSSNVIKITPDLHMGWNFKNIGLTPYVGVDYTWGRTFTKIEMAPGIYFANMYELQHPVTAYAGIDYVIKDKLYLNVEGRSNFTDLWGVDAGIGYVFDIAGGSGPAENSPFLGGGGVGSDTIGACRMLPQLRYAYRVSDWDTDSQLAYPFTDWDVSTHEYYAQLNWGVHPNVDIYAIVGGRSVQMKSSYSGTEYRTDFVPMFLWGFGVKGTFYRADSGFYIGGGLSFTHSFSDNHDVEVYVGGVHVATLPYTAKTSVIEVTPDIHVGWHFNDIDLTPYIGLEYTYGRTYSEIELGPGTEVLTSYDLQNPVKVYAGLDYYINNKLYLNVEGRSNFTNMWGIGAGIGYLFDICEKPKPAPVAPAPVIEPKLEPMSKN